MVLDQIRSKLAIEKKSLFPNDLIPHEKVSNRGINQLNNYISNINPQIILPSILICNKTNVIIDGHHRFHALKLIEVDLIPVSLIDYNSDLILTNEKNSLSKKEIIDSAKDNNIFPPRTSKHVINFKKHIFPIIIISDLRVIN
tara:strand:+ start:107 stop:535 length:429 start_codon:yes stop_codon:yes gene_type:complete